MIKIGWLQSYTDAVRPAKFDLVFQSWDTANKASELSDFSVCSTWGAKDKHIYLLNIYRKRLNYPDLRRAVREQAEDFGATVILIEDRASGTQLIEELISEGMHSVQRYVPTVDKIMRLHAVTGMIENGFVHLPEKAEWLAEYLHELTTFPRAKFDDQTDSTSQALEWFRHSGNITLPPAMSRFCTPRPWDGRLPRPGQTYDHYYTSDRYGWPVGGRTCEKFPGCWDTYCKCYEG